MKRFTRTAMLLGLGALLIMPAVAGCHNSQQDFANMSRDQQIKAMQPTARSIAGANAAMRAHMAGPPPGSTAPPSAAAPGSTAPANH